MILTKHPYHRLIIEMQATEVLRNSSGDMVPIGLYLA
jgi:hypothetical protein